MKKGSGSHKEQKAIDMVSQYGMLMNSSVTCGLGKEVKREENSNNDDYYFMVCWFSGSGKWK